MASLRGIGSVRGIGTLIAALALITLYACRSSHLTDTAQGDSFYTPSSVPASCAPGREGCACDGQISVACGRVTSRSGNYVTCSTGYSTCRNGMWGPCEGNHLVTKSLSGATAGMGGLRLLQATQPCDDPCDPNGCTLTSSDAGDVDAAGVVPVESGVTIDPGKCVGLSCQVATGCPPNEWFQVDMGGGNADAAVPTFDTITLANTVGENDYPRGYAVFVSNDGMTWGSPVATGAGDADTVTITFPQQTARFIRIEQTSASPPPVYNWWSIHELNVSLSLAGGGAGMPLPRTGWIATASASGNAMEPPSAAIDNNLGTRWTTRDIPQHPGSTTLIGTVYDPAGVNPVYNAVVYVPVDPTGALPPMSTGPSCDNCSDRAAIKAVAIAQTGPDGKFLLNHVPSPTMKPYNLVPLVVQVGKWRREVVLSTVDRCAGTFLTADQSRLPRSSVDGNGGSADIPKIAIATGQHDPLECLLLKMGVDPGEFQAPGGPKRIDYYKANGADLPMPAPPESTLVGMTNGGINDLSKYDLVLLPCEGKEDDTTNNTADNLVAYANAGGRVLTTHFSYSWLAMPTVGTPNANNPVPPHNPNPYDPLANWSLNNGTLAMPTAAIDTTFPKGKAFGDWLTNVGASAISGQLPLASAYYDVTSLNAPATQWAHDMAMKETLLFSATTPVSGPACGRVVHSDFHLSAADQVDPGNGGACATNADCGFTATCSGTTCSAAATTFPLSCKQGGAMTHEEDALEFMLLGQTDCISPDTMAPPPPKVQGPYAEVTFTEDFTADCSNVHPDSGTNDGGFTPGTHVVWRELQWQASIPKTASITFSAQTADPAPDGGPPDWTVGSGSDGGKSGPTVVPIAEAKTSTVPPLPDVALIDTGTSGAVTMQLPGAFDKAGVSSRNVLHLIVKLKPTDDGTASPTLLQWTVKADCFPSE